MMLSFSDATPIYLFTLPTDMRKSFDGLSGLISEHFDAAWLTDGSLFVFVNRRRDRMKVMGFDGDGLAIWYKRLEAGRYELPMNPTARGDVRIDARQLRLILDGVDLGSVRRRKRYTPPNPIHPPSVTDDDRATHRTTATARGAARTARRVDRGADRDGRPAAWGA
jgi:transposase